MNGSRQIALFFWISERQQFDKVLSESVKWTSPISFHNNDLIPFLKERGRTKEWCRKHVRFRFTVHLIPSRNGVSARSAPLRRRHPSGEPVIYLRLPFEIAIPTCIPKETTGEAELCLSGHRENYRFARQSVEKRKMTPLSCHSWLSFRLKRSGSCRKRQKPQAPIHNRQTRKFANAKGLNRNTNLT